MKTIGTETTYTGTEHRYLRGHRVLIIAVLKGAASPDFDPDAEGAHITDDDELARHGGIGPGDRVYVQPWIEKEQRFSFVSSDPRAIDLECFAELRK